MEHKVTSFFSGIGGFDHGLELSGMQVVCQSEINSYSRKVLQKHWKNVKLLGDINNIESDDIPESNVWCGGFPCQDLSLANQGKRKGLAGNRSGLFYKMAELINDKKPKWVILENVPGILNSNSGQDFRVLLEKMDEFGYGVSWRVLDAKYFGTPQRRRRVFIVASFGSISSSRVLFEPKGTTITHRQGYGKREILAKGLADKDRKTDSYSIQHAGIGRKPSAGPQAKGYRNDGETYTLDSRGSSDAVCKANASFRVREPSGISKKLDSARYRSLGNAVCVPVIEWIGKRIVSVDAIKD